MPREDEPEVSEEEDDVAEVISIIKAMLESGKSPDDIVNRGYDEKLVFTLWREYAKDKKREEEVQKERDEMKKQMIDMQSKLTEVLSRPPTVIAPPPSQQQQMAPPTPAFGSLEYYLKRQDEKIDKLELRLMEADKEKTSLMLKMIEGRGQSEFDSIGKDLLKSIVNKSVQNTLNPPAPAASGGSLGERVILKLATPENVEKVLGSLNTLGTAFMSYKGREAGVNPYANVVPQQRQRRLPPSMDPPALPPAVPVESPMTDHELENAVDQYLKADAVPVDAKITTDDFLSHVVPEYTSDMTLAQPIVVAVMKMDKLDDHQKLVMMQNAVKSAETMSVLGALIKNVMTGQETVEKVADQVKAANAVDLLLSKSFDGWMDMSAAFAEHPSLTYDYQFLTGEGRTTAFAVYEEVRRRASANKTG